MVTKDEFFLPGNGCDPGYENIRDLEHHFEDKVFVESLWQLYSPHADSHFRKDACQHFNERFWEMYLGCSLLKHGFKISSEAAAGPEFYSMINEQRCWFEAICPSAGNGPDAVPEIPIGEAMCVPADEIILRLRQKF